jgi:hypothetical protein
MANAILSFPNRGDLATLSGGSFALPITNLQNRRLKSYARTSTAADGQFVINAVFPEPKAMRLIAFSRHNFSTLAMYRLRLYSDAAMTVLAYDTGLLPVFDVVYTEESETWDSGNFWDLTLSADDREGLRASLECLLPETYTERAFKFELFDSTNMDDYLQAGRLFVGSGWQPVYNMAYGASVQFEERSLHDEADGGTEFHDEREDPRVVRFNFPRTREDEGMGMAYELMRKQSTTKDVYFIWNPDDKLNLQRRSFLGRLRSLNPLEHDFFDNIATQFEIKEQL